MKKLILIILLLTVSKSIFAQLNPIKNLVYHQWYGYGYPFGCPSANCFEISWSSPDTSTDTLKGYNIYRNSIFWEYTTDTVVTCSGSSTCLYWDFYDPLPFWITVKAVFKINSLESIADDSVLVDNLAINIKEYNKEEFCILKNPVKIGDNISLLLPYNESNKSIINVVSQNGQLIKQYIVGNSSNRITNISSSQLSIGLYFINIQMDGKVLTKKIIIE